jgi:DNA-directed RNA polymerase specialized sigma24 family protein
MVVFLNADNDTADYLREHPISPTQTEIESNRTNNKNIFMVVVIPNEDFLTQIFSFGEELTITNPEFLKRKSDDENGEYENPFRYRHQRQEKDLIGYDYGTLKYLNDMKRYGIGVSMLLQSKYGGLSDAELVAKYQQGDERCFEFLFEKYKRTTLGYLRNLTSDSYTANHLNSITWENVYIALLDGKYQDSGKFENWVKVIAHRVFLNWCEEQKRELPAASFDYDDSVFQGVDEGPERALENRETIEVLNLTVADLPACCRTPPVPWRRCLQGCNTPCRDHRSLSAGPSYAHYSSSSSSISSSSISFVSM